jgi:hypothetical protein
LYIHTSLSTAEKLNFQFRKSRAEQKNVPGILLLLAWQHNFFWDFEPTDLFIHNWDQETRGVAGGVELGGLTERKRCR